MQWEVREHYSVYFLLDERVLETWGNFLIQFHHFESKLQIEYEKIKPSGFCLRRPFYSEIGCSILEDKVFAFYLVDLVSQFWSSINDMLDDPGETTIYSVSHL